MGEIHFRADRLLLCECSRKKHIIPTHLPGVPGSHPPPIQNAEGRESTSIQGGTNES